MVSCTVDCKVHYYVRAFISVNKMKGIRVIGCVRARMFEIASLLMPLLILQLGLLIFHLNVVILNSYDKI